MSPEKSKKSNEDYLHHPLEIIARITFLTLTLAVIWAAVIINIHNELAPAMEFNVPPSAADLDRGTDNAMDRVVRNLEDLRANQIAQQAQVEGLNYTIGFNALVLGMITAFFGALITGVIIFFAIRTRHESIAEARLAAEDKVDVSLEHHKQEFAKIEKQIERFKGLVEQHGDTISRLKEMVFADRDVEDGEGFSETEITAIESAEEKDPKDRTGADWRAIAFDLVEEGKHLDAAMAFIRARDFAGEDENKSRQWYNAGVAFGTARLPEKAIETYKDLIAWGKDSDIPGVREEVASGWFNLGATYTKEIEGWKKQPDKEIETYKDLIAWGKDSDIPGVREAVARGWVNLGVTYTQEIEGWKKQPDKAIETYKDLIAWGKDSDIPGVREEVASGWVNLGATYTLEIEGWKKQPDKEIETYKDLIAWGKDSDIPGVREAVTKAETELEKLL